MNGTQRNEEIQVFISQEVLTCPGPSKNAEPNETFNADLQTRVIDSNPSSYGYYYFEQNLLLSSLHKAETNSKATN